MSKFRQVTDKAREDSRHLVTKTSCLGGSGFRISTETPVLPRLSRKVSQQKGSAPDPAAGSHGNFHCMFTSNAFPSMVDVMHDPDRPKEWQGGSWRHALACLKISYVLMETRGPLDAWGEEALEG